MLYSLYEAIQTFDPNKMSGKVSDVQTFADNILTKTKKEIFSIIVKGEGTKLEDGANSFIRYLTSTVHM